MSALSKKLIWKEILVVLIFMTSVGIGQPKEFSFGIGSNLNLSNPTTFASSSGSYTISEQATADFHLLFSPNFDFVFGLGLNSYSYKTDPLPYGSKENETETIYSLKFQARHLIFADKAVTPYWGAGLNYTAIPTRKGYNSEYDFNILSGSLFFGGQAYLAKNFALFAQIALSYSSYTRNEKDLNTYKKTTYTMNFLSISGSSIGAVFYF